MMLACMQWTRSPALVPKGNCVLIHPLLLPTTPRAHARSQCSTGQQLDIDVCCTVCSAAAALVSLALMVQSPERDESVWVTRVCQAALCLVYTLDLCAVDQWCLLWVPKMGRVGVCQRFLGP